MADEVKEVNPLATLIEEAAQIRNFLGDSITALESAIEADHAARRLAKQLEAEYNDIETEWTYSQMAAPVPEGTKVTVDQRKAQVAAALVKAKANGLGKPWRNAQSAKYASEDAAMTLEQASKRFSATRTAAELTAAILIAATKGG